MYQVIGKAVHPRCPQMILLAAVLLLHPSWALAGERVLKIDPRHALGLQYMPDEVSTLLEDLGYAWVPVHDPEAGHGVKAAKEQEQWRMQFTAAGAPGIVIDVHIRVDDSVTGLHFRWDDGTMSDAAAAERLQQVKERAQLEFGADSVSEAHSFFTP
jgi:hypothetical protein